MPETLTTDLKSYLDSFNGSLESLKPFFRAVNQSLELKSKSLDECQNRFKESEEMMIDLVQRNKELEQFAYIVSHNLRSSVAHIQGLTYIFKTSDDNSVKLKCGDGLVKAALRLDEVIKDLNHILSVKKEVTEIKSSVNVLQLISEVRDELQDFIKKQNGTIVTNIPQDLCMFTLKGYLHSIFYNLIGNSMKYRKEGVAPILHIESEEDEENLILRFKDNGLGIDLETNGSKIFGLYMRFHEAIEGKGIGLYMVKSQVETLGGKISVSSEVGAGSEFKIIFNKQILLAEV